MPNEYSIKKISSWRIQLVFSLVMALLFGFYHYVNSSYNLNKFFVHFLMTFTYEMVIWQFARWIIYYTNKRYSWKTEVRKRIIVTVLMAFITAIIISFSLDFLFYKLASLPNPPELRHVILDTIISLMTLLLILSMINLYSFFEQSKQLAVQTIESELKDYYQRLIENVHDVIQVIDQNHQTTFVTETVQQLFGISTEEFKRLDPFSRFSEEDRETFLSFFNKKKVEGFQRFKFEASIVRIDCSERNVEITISNASNTPLINGYVFIYSDITDRILFEKEENRRNVAQAQFESLKNQVNPHFLFNSLNVLSSLIHIDTELSEKFIDQLAKSYRYLLEQRDNDLVQLRTEMDFVDSFTFLLKIRFEDKLNVHITLNEEILDKLIAPLTLQLLIENAVKHNVVSNDHPLEIHIFEEGNYLIVQNNIQLRKQQLPSTGVGIANILSRYSMLSKVQPEFVSDEKIFIVKIPLITNQKS